MYYHDDPDDPKRITGSSAHVRLRVPAHEALKEIVIQADPRPAKKPRGIHVKPIACPNCGQTDHIFIKCSSCGYQCTGQELAEIELARLEQEQEKEKFPGLQILQPRDVETIEVSGTVPGLQNLQPDAPAVEKSSSCARPADDPAEAVAPPEPTGKQGGMAHKPSPSAETAIDLLCSIAGDDQTHIEMRQSGPKYTTVDGPITPDLAARHIRGEIMLGTSLRHIGGKTRMLRLETDEEEGRALLLDGALALQNASACPIFEDSPSIDHPGGAHLMLIFDSLVDAASARATLLHWAPMLKDVKESWPNGGARVRLPAGRYRRNGADAWCAVWQVGGVHRTQKAAFEWLLTCQTPASWVTVTPAPPPAFPPRPQLTSSGGWIPPTRHIVKGDRDNKLRDFALAMHAKHGMAEEEIVAELTRIRDECCAFDPDDIITDACLIEKARRVARRFPRGGGGL